MDLHARRTILNPLVSWDDSHVHVFLIDYMHIGLSTQSNSLKIAVPW